jgi:HEAT repeat protein
MNRISRGSINRAGIRTMALIVLLATMGCKGEERGPTLAGGREVTSWLADLHSSKPQVRRQAVLKLGNVGDSDSAVADGLVQALRDSDPLVRRDAVLAVAKLKKPSDAVIAQLKAMHQSDRDPLIRDYANRAIVHFGQAE